GMVTSGTVTSGDVMSGIVASGTVVSGTVKPGRLTSVVGVFLSSPPLASTTIRITIAATTAAPMPISNPLLGPFFGGGVTGAKVVGGTTCGGLNPPDGG